MNRVFFHFSLFLNPAFCVNIKQTLSFANKVVPLQINSFQKNRVKCHGIRCKDTIQQINQSFIILLLCGLQKDYLSLLIPFPLPSLPISEHVYFLFPSIFPIHSMNPSIFRTSLFSSIFPSINHAGLRSWGGMSLFIFT